MTKYEQTLQAAEQYLAKMVDVDDVETAILLTGFAMEQREWTVIDGPETLPQWPKNYLWQWTNAKGKVFHKVQYFPVTHSREWFASVYEAWQPIEPYSPQEAVVKESLTTETL